MWRQSERGQSLILLAISLTAMLGFLALTVDVGRWYVARQRAVNVCDMAALAGTMELSSGNGRATYAQSAALAVVDGNNAGGMLVGVSHVVGRGNPDIIVSYYNDTAATNPSLTADVVWTDSLGNAVPRPAPGRGFLVCGRVSVPPVFGRVLGFRDARPVPARSAVALGQISTIIGGLLPFGVSKDNIADIENLPAATVEQTLTFRSWQDSWTGSPGAFGTLGLGDASGSTLEFNITWGYAGTFAVDQCVPVTDGNKTGPLQSGIDSRLARSQFATIDAWMGAFNSLDTGQRNTALQDSRVVVFPIIDKATVTTSGSGTAQSVQIAGFATYAISEWNQPTKQVSGYFVKSAYEGSVGSTGVSFGTLAYHLL